jgi:hypothetical protein
MQYSAAECSAGPSRPHLNRLRPYLILTARNATSKAETQFARAIIGRRSQIRVRSKQPNMQNAGKESV